MAALTTYAYPPKTIQDIRGNMAAIARRESFWSEELRENREKRPFAIVDHVINYCKNIKERILRHECQNIFIPSEITPYYITLPSSTLSVFIYLQEVRGNGDFNHSARRFSQTALSVTEWERTANPRPKNNNFQIKMDTCETNLKLKMQQLFFTFAKISAKWNYMFSLL